MVDIRICIGTSCHLNGSRNVLVSFQHMIEENHLHDHVHLEAAFCMEKCGKTGVAISVNDKIYRVDADKSRQFFKDVVLPLISAEA